MNTTTPGVYGLEVGGDESPLSVLRVNDRATHAGNVVIEVGRQNTGGRGWSKTEHVVITPGELPGLLAELAEHWVTANPDAADAGPAVNVPARVVTAALAEPAGEQQQLERDHRHAVLVEHYAPAPEYRHRGTGDRYALVCVESGHGLDGTLVTTHSTVIDACDHAGTLVCDGWEPVAVFDLDERTAVSLVVGAPAVSVGTAVADPGNILKTEAT